MRCALGETTVLLSETPSANCHSVSPVSVRLLTTARTVQQSFVGCTYGSGSIQVRVALSRQSSSARSLSYDSTDEGISRSPSKYFPFVELSAGSTIRRARAFPDSSGVCMFFTRSKRNSGMILGRMLCHANRTIAGYSRASPVPGINPGSNALTVMPSGSRSAKP